MNASYTDTQKAAVFTVEMHDPAASYGARIRPMDAKLGP